MDVLTATLFPQPILPQDSVTKSEFGKVSSSAVSYLS